MYKLLIVDDEDLTIRVLRNEINWTALEFEAVYEAYSAKKAIEVLENNHVDIIICDIEMPGDNGIKLTEWINANRPDIKVIIYTSHADFDYAQKLLKLHVYDYILKPADFKIMEKIIIRLVNELETDRGTAEKYQVEDEKSTSSILDQVNRYIDDNLLSSELSRNEIANAVFINPAYLSRLFKRATGTTLSEYIIKKKIEIAKEMLRFSDKKISVISEELGYSYFTHFTALFKKHAGVTPKEYRDRFKG